MYKDIVDHGVAPTVMSIYDRFSLHDRVHIESRYVNRNARDSVINTLKNSTEGVCSKHGYIKPGSVCIHSIGFGVLNAERGGGATFDVTFDAEVCNPKIGSTIRCRVENLNGTAAFATNLNGERVIDMIIPPRPQKFSHAFPFEDVKVGDIVDVSVVGKRYHLGQSRIICAGQIASSPIPEDANPMTMSSVTTVADQPLTAINPVMNAKSESLESSAHNDLKCDEDECGDEDDDVSASGVRDDGEEEDVDIDASDANDVNDDNDVNDVPSGGMQVLEDESDRDEEDGDPVSDTEGDS